MADAPMIFGKPMRMGSNGWELKGCGLREWTSGWHWIVYGEPRESGAWNTCDGACTRIEEAIMRRRQQANELGT